ncbi:hypothetical protein ACFGVR_17675 [Mucilaginibacter sp. AW1-3]
MKKIILPALLIILVISACTKEPGASTASLAIVGKWYYTQDTLRTYKNGVLQSINTTGVTLNGTSFNQFNNAGRGSVLISGNSNAFTYSITGKIITLYKAAQSIGGVAIPPATEFATIKTLTATQLVLFYSDTSADAQGNTILSTEVACFGK